MWWEIDFTRFMRQLIPPVLRGKVMMALCRVLAEPICYVGRLLKTYRKGVDARLDITANVQSIERALNDAFFLTDNQIYIETEEDKGDSAFYYQGEGEPNYFYRTGGRPFYLKERDEVVNRETFVIYIPTFLATSTDANEDEYKGANLQVVYDKLNFYKPAGRAYRIELYDYE